MRVVITGAAGRIGSQVVEELSASHELLIIDRRPVNGRKSFVADLSQQPTTTAWRNWLGSKSSRWSDAFKEAQVVIHLAANAQTSASWEKVLPNNIHATWNVLEAAARHRVPRVVFASSNWAVKAVETKLAPSCYDPDGPKIDSETPPFSLTTYGLSKAFGELAGRMFVDEGKLESFVAVRIGSYNPTPSTDEIVRARWIGVDDIRSLFRHCVEAELTGFHVVYAVSAQKTAPYDLTHTRQALSWSPQQVAANREI
jgi:nucleoside-diphosphate-sugar epimerase